MFSQKCLFQSMPDQKTIFSLENYGYWLTIDGSEKVFLVLTRINFKWMEGVK